MWILASLMMLASHEPRCHRDHDKLVTELKSQFGEELVAVAVVDNGTLLELLASDETGTWTILVTYPPPRGETCGAGSGHGFELIPPGEES